MNRLGITADEAAALAPRAQTENHGITLLMSHLACAEIADHPLTANQIRLFRELRMLYHGIPASLVNSSGIFLGDSAHFDIARPGAALYGINPTPNRDNPMRSVVELTGRILQVRNVPQGETVGYDAIWKARRASRIAIAALGYADGVLRSAGGIDAKANGAAIVAGKRCPIVGVISMDLTCIDVTELRCSGPARRSRDVYRQGFIGRRSGGFGQHNRLRDSDPAWPAQSSRLSRRIGSARMVARGQNFVCQSCGAAASRWAGRCEACGAWNTLVEEGAATTARSSRKGRLFAVEPLKGQTHEAPRLASGIAEFDRVTGGGLVRGSVLLLGGDPGIGKSTLLIEVAADYARHGHRAVYISGEEAVAQVRLRAERLGLSDAAVELAAETSVEDIVATLSQGHGAATSRHRFDPDHVDPNRRSCARNGDPGARIGG